MEYEYYMLQPRQIIDPANWFAPVESSPFTNRVGVPFFHWPRTCLFGLHAHLSFASLLNAPVGIPRWASPSPVPSSKQACQNQLCKWKFPWKTILRPRSGSTIFFAICCRKCSDSIFLLRVWEIWTPSWKEFNLRWKSREIQFHAWHSSGPVPARRQTWRPIDLTISPERAFRETILRSELPETRTIASKPARYEIVTSNPIVVLE